MTAAAEPNAQSPSAIKIPRKFPGSASSHRPPANRAAMNKVRALKREAAKRGLLDPEGRW